VDDIKIRRLGRADHVTRVEDERLSKKKKGYEWDIS
jgi:hypothetical protein